jgi:IS4 transposase
MELQYLLIQYSVVTYLYWNLMQLLYSISLITDLTLNQLLLKIDHWLA